MARIEKDGTLVLELAIGPETKWRSSEELFASLHQAAEEAYLEAVADPEMQNYMGLIMGGAGEAGSAEAPEDDGEVGELVKLMN